MANVGQTHGRTAQKQKIKEKLKTKPISSEEKVRAKVG